MSRSFSKKIIFIALLALSSSLCAEDLKNENIMMGIPDEFKLGYQDYNKMTHLRLIEFIPKNETVENWSQMITLNIFHHNLKLSTKEYIQETHHSWSKACENSYTQILSTGNENNYEYTLSIAYCPKNKMTNKEEYTYFKAIKGNDSFYVVQKAFSYMPSKDEIITAMNHFKKIFICDTRLNNCPKVTK